MKRILITGAGGPLGVNITRAFLNQDPPVFTVGTDCARYHLPLALTDERLLIPPATAGEPYLKALNEAIVKFDIQMVFPTHPTEVRTVSLYRDRIKARTYLPRHETILAAQNKYSSYRIWTAKGLPVPKTFLLSSPEEVEQAFEAIKTRPVWVRGSGVPGSGIGVASLPCRNASQATAWIDYWEGWGQLAASEFLPGGNYTWMGIFREGELITSQCRERLEYVIPHVSPSGITGAPAVSRTIHRADINEYGEAAVRALDPGAHGVFFTDLKCDDDDVPRITEVNGGRFGTTINFYTTAGANFPKLLTDLALDAPLGEWPKQDVLPAGLYWLRTLDCGPVLLKEEDLPEALPAL